MINHDTMQVLVNESLSTYDKVVYIVLCSFVTAENCECSPSVEDIAKRASCSGRQVRRCLDTLEEHGYMKREFAPGYATTYVISRLET